MPKSSRCSRPSETPEFVQERLNRRSGGFDLGPILALDQQLLELEGSRSQLQARSNEIGKAVGQQIQQGADPKGPEVAALREEGNHLKQQIADLEAPEREIRAQLDAILMTLPNLPADSTPQGKDETENLQARRLMDHCRGTGFVA